MRIVKIGIVALLFPSIFLFAQGSKNLRQYVRSWPAPYDTTGVHWTVYNLYSAEGDWLIETSIGSVTLFLSGEVAWNANLGNFQGSSPPWSSGDTIVCIGSMDTVYISNPGGYDDQSNHTGFYWIYSDTVTSATPELWSPDDTVRVMPKPLTSKTGPGGGANDTIWIKIPNPRETRAAINTGYDVLGYWFTADTSGTGTPAAYNGVTGIEIDFVAVQGVYGDTTTFYMLESDSFAAWTNQTVYFAYKIVARPDTTGARASAGYATYYFSQNSDPVSVYQNVIGVEEQGSQYKTQIYQVYPNPFVTTARIEYSLECPGNVRLEVYDVTGQLQMTIAHENRAAGMHSMEIHGQDLPSGVYFYTLETREKDFTGRFVKLD